LVLAAILVNRFIGMALFPFADTTETRYAEIARWSALIFSSMAVTYICAGAVMTDAFLVLGSGIRRDCRHQGFEPCLLLCSLPVNGSTGAFKSKNPTSRAPFF